MQYWRVVSSSQTPLATTAQPLGRPGQFAPTRGDGPPANQTQGYSQPQQRPQQPDGASYAQQQQQQQHERSSYSSQPNPYSAQAQQQPPQYQTQQQQQPSGSSYGGEGVARNSINANGPAQEPRQGQYGQVRVPLRVAFVKRWRK